MSDGRGERCDLIWKWGTMEGQEQNLSGANDVPAIPQAAPLPVIPYATPAGTATNGGVWRAGRKLVVPNPGMLPARCVKCNEPVPEGPRKMTFYYHHPALFLLILVNIMVFAIVALVSRKKGIVYVAICQKHRQNLRVGTWSAAVMILGGIALVIAGAVNGQGTISALGALVVVAGIILVFLYRIVWAAKIDATTVWLKGAGPAFLAEIPEAPWQ
jgi:hypothetical protein